MYYGEIFVYGNSYYSLTSSTAQTIANRMDPLFLLRHFTPPSHAQQLQQPMVLHCS